MRIWRKINRGAVLTAIVIFGVVIYLAAVRAANEQSRPELERLTREYVQTEIQLLLLPVGEAAASGSDGSGSSGTPQTSEPAPTTAQLDAWQAEAANRLKPFFPNDGVNLDFTLRRLRQSWSTYDFSNPPALTEVRIQKVEFRDEGPLVHFEPIVQFDPPRQVEHYERVYMLEMNRIAFQKSNNQWKVAYASIMIDPQARFRGGMIYG